MFIFYNQHALYNFNNLQHHARMPGMHHMPATYPLLAGSKGREYVAIVIVLYNILILQYLIISKLLKPHMEPKRASL